MIGNQTVGNSSIVEIINSSYSWQQRNTKCALIRINTKIFSQLTLKTSPRIQELLPISDSI